MKYHIDNKQYHVANPVKTTFCGLKLTNSVTSSHMINVEDGCLSLHEKRIHRDAISSHLFCPDCYNVYYLKKVK